MNEKELRHDLEKVKKAGYSLQDLPEEKVKAVLADFTAAVRQNTGPIIKANQKDLARMNPASPLYDRLLLNEERILAIAADIEKVAGLPSPVGEVIEARTLPNGADLSRIRVPLGVVAVIYEARPNVTMDVFSLCLRTQNACVMRGGTDADHTNRQIVALMHQVLQDHGISPYAAYLMPPEREHMPVLLQAHDLVDVCIPRGSQALIDFVREQASIPVIETGRGVVHIYFDESGDADMGKAVICNAKTRRPSVCNSLDTLLVHRTRLDDLEILLEGLDEKKIFIYADDGCAEKLRPFYPKELIGQATAESYNEEFLELKMNLKLVDDIDGAMVHIRRHGSGHTDAIIAEDGSRQDKFVKGVDAAVVMVNASTAFSDGGEFGLGAEIGISTQKLHARGPMGLLPLTSYKWILRGSGQIRG